MLNYLIECPVVKYPGRTLVAVAAVLAMAATAVTITRTLKAQAGVQRIDEELAEVQRTIIKNERPAMGEREVEFWRIAIYDAAEKAGITQYADVLTAKIAQESNFDRFRVSTAGARCAAQIMPAHYKTPNEISEIESCLTLGAKIFANELKNCLTAERALRCYYAGPGNSQKGTLRSANGYNLGGYSDAILTRVYVAQTTVRAAHAAR